MFNDTVAAISTPYGRGGIAVIRLSGPDAFAVADRVFLPRSGKPLSETPLRTAQFGDILPPGQSAREEAIDDGIALRFQAPHSYTGEDVVEISCHGGILLSETVLASVLAAGAVPAGPGEFTRRAFVNGKLALSEAESVIDLIDAATDDQLLLARSHRTGVLSEKLASFYNTLLSLVSQTYVFADYPDEDLTDLSPCALKEALIALRKDILALCDTYRAGHAIGEGIYTVTAGKPNTGKSSLMNALLGRPRAIVSEKAGTTRDYLEESVPVGRILLRLVDTAGIRGTGADAAGGGNGGDGGSRPDAVEEIGIARSLEQLARAELILAVFDASRAPDEEDRAFFRALSRISAKKIAIFNKCDLVSEEAKQGGMPPAFSAKGFAPEAFDALLFLSAKTGEGIDKLKETIEGFFIEGKIDYRTDAILSSARQRAALIRAAEALGRAVSALDSGFTQDVAGLDMEEAMAALGETDGRTVSADIVDSIFHRFCVGK